MKVKVMAMIIVAVIAVAAISAYFLVTKEGVQGLQIVFKDQEYAGLPEVKLLQPTITEIQLQNQNGDWITIWSDPEGRTLTLTTGGAEVVLANVSLESGTFVRVRLFVSTIYVEVDINLDGDADDENVEVILPFPTWATLPPPKPVEGLPPRGEGWAPPQVLFHAVTPEGVEVDVGPPPPGWEPGDPLWFAGPAPAVHVHRSSFLNEKHTVTVDNWLLPVFEADFTYDGSGGSIVFDFTLNSAAPKHAQIELEVSTTTQ